MPIFKSKPLRYLLLKLRFPRSKENIEITVKTIHAGATLTGPNLWVLMAAIFIASLGLNMNSTAVIIGAMLISPLMGPIIAFGLGLGTDDISLIKKSTRNFITMVVISAAASTLYFFISPVKEAGSELLGRTSPTIYDVLIAFFGGLAGIIAGSSTLRSSNVIPGVAIATALMPPLCTMGYGLSNLRWEYVFGAFYLFMINSVFIALATYFVVTILRFPSVNQSETGGKTKKHFMITFIIILMILPSVYLTFHIVKKYFYKQNAEAFVLNEVQDKDHIVVTSKFTYKPGNSLLELVMVGEAFDSLQTEELKTKMKSYGLEDCRLTLYQGPDSRAAAQGLFDELHSDMQVQRLSIKEMYIKMDSLKRGLNGALIPDSLQLKIAGEIYKTDTTLHRLNLERSLSYNPALNKNDTLWKVTAAFTGLVTPDKRMSLEAWLRTRLQSPNVILVTE